MLAGTLQIDERARMMQSLRSMRKRTCPNVPREVEQLLFRPSHMYHYRVLVLVSQPLLVIWMHHLGIARARYKVQHSWTSFWYVSSRRATEITCVQHLMCVVPLGWNHSGSQHHPQNISISVHVVERQQIGYITNGF